MRGGTSTPATWPGPSLRPLAISIRGGSISLASPTSTTREMAMQRCPAAPKPAAVRALRVASGLSKARLARVGSRPAWDLPVWSSRPACGILGVRHDDGVVLRAEVGLHALAW